MQISKNKNSLTFFWGLRKVESLSKKIHKYPKYIRKPFLKAKSRVSTTNISFAEDSISTCDIHSNAESFYLMEEERPEEIPKVKIFFF